jgi:DNA gyrase/topoisomerase IV subunit B
MQEPNDHSSESIKVLDGLESIRRRPCMYICDLQKEGLQALLRIAVELHLDNASGSHPVKTLEVFTDGRETTVLSDGRPLAPRGLYLICTQLHAGC